MLNKKDILQVRAQLEFQEEARDSIIRASRDVVQKSKEVIYELHRDGKEAGKRLKELNTLFSNLHKAAKKDMRLILTGAYKIAAQEYVEAVALHDILTKKTVPTNAELKLEPEHYLLGLLDVSGELVRRAINQSIKGKTKEAQELKDVVSNLYDELMLFDFPNGELRKKFDGIKYDLQKLENLILELHLKDKI